MSQDGIYFQCIDLKFFMLHYEVFLHVLQKIPRVYVIALHLRDHSSLTRFEKLAAKTLQHGHRHDGILMLYDMINAYE